MLDKLFLSFISFLLLLSFLLILSPDILHGIITIIILCNLQHVPNTRTLTLPNLLTHAWPNIPTKSRQASNIPKTSLVVQVESCVNKSMKLDLVSDVRVGCSNIVLY